MSNLTELANQFGSDKGTTGGRIPHRYTYLYDFIFRPLRDLPIQFLEIGLCRGGPEIGGSIERKATSPSVLMWKQYFRNASLTGFDISDFSHQEDERFKFVRGDSGNAEDMLRLAVARPHYDVILEDASHASYHQQMAIKHLWAKLSAGGLFIIEDVNWQPPVFEEKLPQVPKTGDFFQNWFENRSYEENCLLSREFMVRLSEETEFASFFPSFTPFTPSKIKLVVIQKK